MVCGRSSRMTASWPRSRARHRGRRRDRARAPTRVWGGCGSSIPSTGRSTTPTACPSSASASAWSSTAGRPWGSSSTRPAAISTRRWRAVARAATASRSRHRSGTAWRSAWPRSCCPQRGWQARARAVTRATQVNRVLGSSALALAYVADGRFDVYVQAGGLSAWDVAAAGLDRGRGRRHRDRPGRRPVARHGAADRQGRRRRRGGRPGTRSCCGSWRPERRAPRASSGSSTTRDSFRGPIPCAGSGRSWPRPAGGCASTRATRGWGDRCAGGARPRRRGRAGGGGRRRRHPARRRLGLAGTARAAGRPARRHGQRVRPGDGHPRRAGRGARWALVEGVERPLDLGRVTLPDGRWARFVIAAGLGLDGAILGATPAEPQAPSSGRPRSPSRRSPWRPAGARGASASASTGRRRGRGRRGSSSSGNTRLYANLVWPNPQARPDDGLLDLCLLPGVPMPRPGAPGGRTGGPARPAGRRGRVARRPRRSRWTCSRATCRSSWTGRRCAGPVSAAATFAAEPAALRVRLPSGGGPARHAPEEVAGA